MKTKTNIGIAVALALLVGLIAFAVVGSSQRAKTIEVTTSETPATVEHSNFLAKLDQSAELKNVTFDEPYIVVLYDENKEISYDMYQGYLQATTEDQSIVPYVYFVEWSTATDMLKEKLVVTEPSIAFFNGDMIGTTPIRGYTASDFQSYFRNLSVNTFRNVEL